MGVGDKKENTGVLILISKDDHKSRIEVGYGLEGIINDGKAGRILKSMLTECELPPPKRRGLPLNSSPDSSRGNFGYDRQVTIPSVTASDRGSIPCV